jgi:uncharacterized protein YbbK (DUF523 family)
MDKSILLRERLMDRRSHQIIFLSHCLLNENTRYLGGACSGGCVRGVVTQCLARDLGIVQLPCPEELVWGGVLKRWVLAQYGSKGTLRYQLRWLLLPAFVLYTRLRYRRLANRIADQIRDYLASGFVVAGVVGVDGSPSCGVAQTLNLPATLDAVAGTDAASLTAEQMNDLIRANVQPGSGLFVIELRKALQRRKIAVPFHAHDLIGELNGSPSTLILPAPAAPHQAPRNPS